MGRGGGGTNIKKLMQRHRGRNTDLSAMSTRISIDRGFRMKSVIKCIKMQNFFPSKRDFSKGKKEE